MSTTEADDALRGTTKSVLLVEDDLALLRVLQQYFKDAGYATAPAGNVGEAWRAILAEAPDAVVVDVHLPGAYGWELADRLRTDPRFHRMPVVVISEVVVAADKERAEALNATLIQKPFEAREVIEAIGGLLEGSRRVPMTAVRATLFLSSYRIEGTLHLPPEHTRFSDGWEAILRDSRTLVPVTEVTVYSHAGDTVATNDFLQVAKAQIQLVVPVDWGEGTEGAAPGPSQP